MLNPIGLQGDAKNDYTKYFNRRFPNTINGARKLLEQRDREKICLNKRHALVPGLRGGAEDIDVAHDMKRFGDDPQSWYERNVQIGNFEIKTDDIQVVWFEGDGSLCYSFSTTMYILENTGDNRLGVWFRERSVRMGEWPISGEGCCEE